jgi:hypothetical protein
MVEMAMNSATHLAARIKDHLDAHREFVLILVLTLAFRLMASLVFRPGGYLGDMSDFIYFRRLMSFVSQGYYPLVNFWIEYPPVFPWLLVGLYRLSLLFPAWTEPGTGFYLLLSTFFTLVETGNLILFYALARRLYGRGRAVRLSWIYAALFVPVFTLFFGFDGLALLFLLWAVLFMVDQRAVASGIAVGLGFMTKLVPIAAAPAAWQHLSGWPKRVKYALALGLTLLSIAAPFLIVAPDFLIQSFKSSGVRSSWETVWALIDGYYSFGVAGGVDRFDPAMAGAAQHPSRLPWLAVTIGFGLLYLVLFTRRVDWSDRRRAVAFVALTQNLLTLYFKGYSPQFLIMLLPFVILLIPGWRGVAYALLLSAINLVEHPIYFVVLPDQHWLLAGTVLLRTLILIVISVEYAAQVYDWRPAERWWRRIAAGVTALVVVAGLAGTVVGLRAYSQSRYETSAFHPAMEAFVSQAAPGASLVTDDQFTYEQLYPFLHEQFHLVLVETFDYLPPWAPRLAEAAAQPSGQVWVYATSGSPLHTWLAERYPPLARYESDGWLLSGWATK